MSHGHDHHHAPSGKLEFTKSLEGFDVPKGFEEYHGAFKSKSVEEWAHYRENTLKFFRWNRKTISLALIFGVVAPYGVYRAARGELLTRDKKAGVVHNRM